MSSYLIDRIPDDRLPSLTPRLIGKHTVLVTLADCAPFLSMRPLELDELRTVLVRLLTVPGGPLVSLDGAPIGTLLVDLPWHVEDRPIDELTLSGIGLGAVFDTAAMLYDQRQVMGREMFVAAFELALARQQPWWPRAKSLLERAASCNCGDTMLAGLPAP